MPNATVRANARPMSEKTDRRAILRGMLTAGVAVGAASGLTTAAPAAINPSHPDAQIFASIERCRVANESLSKAHENEDDVLWAQVGPLRLHAAETWTEADAALWPDITPGEVASVGEVQRLRACLAATEFWGEPGFPPEAFAERARKMVAVRDHFAAELDRSRASPEVLGASAETDARFSEWHAAALELAGTRARTVEGMIAKLVMVTTCYYGEGNPEGTYDGILESAALDAVALNGSAA